MRIRLLVFLVAIASAACFSGCRSGAGGAVGPFPPDIRGASVTAAELGKIVELGEKQQSGEGRVTDLKGADVRVIHTTGAIEPYYRKKHDQVFFVIAGQAISEVAGIRDVVGPGSIVAVPRGDAVRFVRGDADTGKPLLLVRVTVPRDDVKDTVKVETKEKK